MVHISQCPACGSTELIPYLNCKDYTVSHETFSLLQCKNCELGITSPQPDPADLHRYYESDEYISHSGKTTGLSSIYHLARSFNLNWKKLLIRKHSKTRSILDFGCGTGEFLNTMKLAGWEVSGVEPSELARKKATDKIGAHVYSGLDQFTSINFTVITLWHVLEHIPDLQNTLQELLSKLDTNGTLFLAVPNHQSPDAKRYQSDWAGFDVPRHLWHFSKKSMHQLVKKAGAKIVNIVPMKLDAFYVSILSERYSRQNSMTFSAMIRGLLAGLASNLKAGKDNYSSLIYIVKKS